MAGWRWEGGEEVPWVIGEEPPWVRVEDPPWEEVMGGITMGGGDGRKGMKERRIEMME